MTRMRAKAVDFHGDANYLKPEGCLRWHFPDLGKGMKLSMIAKRIPFSRSSKRKEMRIKVSTNHETVDPGSVFLAWTGREYQGTGP